MPDDDYDDLDEATLMLSIGPLGVSVPPLVHRHVLVQMDGSDVGKVHALSEKQEFSIGRRNDCDLVLEDEGVSRRHARITFEDGAYVVEDLDSANGTVVRGGRVGRHRLKDGDVLQFGPFVSVRYSITDHREEGLLRHLYEASVRDPLTGAYNREYLAERLKSEIAFAQRHSTETALIMFDLDHFKQVNDTHGHRAGDAVLIAVVNAVTSELRAEDLLARYGGEEFLVSVRGIDLQSVAVLGERIRQRNDRDVEFEGQAIRVSVSVGCAAAGELAEPSVDSLIALADKRMYAAKDGGRNRVVFS